jgi:hypothetical protein
MYSVSAGGCMASPSDAEPGMLPKPPMLRVALLTRKQFKENPDAWLLVDKILQEAQYPQTKCMCIDCGG